MLPAKILCRERHFLFLLSIPGEPIGRWESCVSMGSCVGCQCIHWPPLAHPPPPWLAGGLLPIPYWGLEGCQTGFHMDGEQPKWDFSTRPLASTDRYCSGVGWKIICLLISCTLSLCCLTSEETNRQDPHFPWSLLSFIMGKTFLAIKCSLTFSLPLFLVY